MPLCRSEVAGIPHCGVIEGERVTPLAAPSWQGTERQGGGVPLAPGQPG